MSARYAKCNFSAQTGASYVAAIDANAEVCFRTAAAFAPSQSSPPDMAVRVEAGALLSSATLTEVPAQTTTLISPPTATTRIDRVVVNRTTGTASVITGVEASDPVAPPLTAQVLPVARVVLQPGQTSITDSDIIDERISGGGDMLRANNLSDLEDVAVARDNLGLGTAALLDAGTAPGNVVQLDANGQIPAVLRPNIRVRLTADATLNVATTGNDATGDGTLSAPFATLQRAYNYAQEKLDLSGYTLTIKLADGIYTSGAWLNGPLVGQKGTNVTIAGNAGNPGAVILSAPSDNAISAQYGAMLVVQDLTLTAATYSGLYVAYCARVFCRGLVFGACPGSHVVAFEGGAVQALGNYKISGSAGLHWNAGPGGMIRAESLTVSLSGTPAFTTFAAATSGSTIYCPSVSFQGSATGSRYYVTGNSLINTFSGRADYLPGNSGGGSNPAIGGYYA